MTFLSLGRIQTSILKNSEFQRLENIVPSKVNSPT
jgi:hypothetical protein